MSQDQILNQKSQDSRIGECASTRLIPLTDWSKYHPWPPLGGLRHLVFHKGTNGFAKVVKKSGRRILIDERKFFEFVEEQNEGKNK
jgi:hypothetical protein